MQMSVRHISQSASGGSYVVKYRAEFDVAQLPDVSVTIANTLPADADEELIGLARDSIRDGFIRVLEPRSLGARIVIHDLVIHDVDFKMGQFTKWTAYELASLLGTSSAQ